MQFCDLPPSADRRAQSLSSLHFVIWRRILSSHYTRAQPPSVVHHCYASTAGCLPDSCHHARRWGLLLVPQSPEGPHLPTPAHAPSLLYRALSLCDFCAPTVSV